jgi:hypothetical protein
MTVAECFLAEAQGTQRSSQVFVGDSMANMQESSPVFSRKGAKSAKFFMCFY